jgi:DNA-binding XRE family transcriptional regulator
MNKNKIDYWMEQKGGKNNYIAKLCGVSEQTFSKWRKNKTQPDILQGAVIAKALSINVDDLIEWGNQNEKD